MKEDYCEDCPACGERESNCEYCTQHITWLMYGVLRKKEELL